MPKGTPMILVLDADEGFRSGVAGGLRSRGLRVHELDAAADLGSTPTPDAVLAIVLGGDDDSLGLADRLHEMFPAAPVVMATAERDLAARPDVHDRDFLYCFCKPVSAAALSGIVEILLPCPAPAVARLA